MRQALRGVIVAIVIAALLCGAVGAIRWARRGGAGAAVAASALLLALGMGVVVTPPQRGVEQAQEETDKTGGESGDPPA
jgi:O-antigen ligase